jgi:hypothetical protein
MHLQTLRRRVNRIRLKLWALFAQGQFRIVGVLPGKTHAGFPEIATVNGHEMPGVLARKATGSARFSPGILRSASTLG